MICHSANAALIATSWRRIFRKHASTCWSTQLSRRTQRRFGIRFLFGVRRLDAALLSITLDQDQSGVKPPHFKENVKERTMKERRLTLALMDPPYESANSTTALRIISAALEKGID